MHSVLSSRYFSVPSGAQKAVTGTYQLYLFKLRGNPVARSFLVLLDHHGCWTNRQTAQFFSSAKVYIAVICLLFMAIIIIPLFTQPMC